MRTIELFTNVFSIIIDYFKYVIVVIFYRCSFVCCCCVCWTIQGQTIAGSDEARKTRFKSWESSATAAATSNICYCCPSLLCCCCILHLVLCHSTAEKAAKISDCPTAYGQTRTRYNCSVYSTASICR